VPLVCKKTVNLALKMAVIIPTLESRTMNDGIQGDNKDNAGGASDMGTTVVSKQRELKRRATVICRHDREILFVRKRNAKWNLPGGRVETGETPLQAAIREMAEETGMTFEELSYVAQYEEDKVIHFLFEARRADDQKPRPCNEIDDCRWFKPKDLQKRNVRGPIRTLLKRCASGADDLSLRVSAAC
jgi:8-oxo-dGTP diphosphatase